MLVPSTVTRLCQALVIALLLAGCAAQQTDTPAAKSEVSTPVASPADAAPPPAVAPLRVERSGALSRGDEASASRESFNRLLKSQAERNAAAGLQYAPIAEPPVETARYGKLDDNPVRVVRSEPVSTFSIDVDTGAYANIRRFLRQGRVPPADAVRVEELVNYFPYAYPLPEAGGAPFGVSLELAPTPWNADTHLLRIGLKGQDLAKQSLPPANLVFLVDVSGSMSPPERLPLLKASLRLLVPQLRAQDRVSLVVYASGTGVVLEPTAGDEHEKIMAAIDGLRAQGSTNGEGGLRLAYRMARQAFIAGGINRILLATDGDFNVGITDRGQIKQLVENERRAGISLSTLGFGTNNYNEHLMEQIADAGDGSYSYIDQLNEGHKVLVNEMTSTLATIAKDVKIQVEFNPAEVLEYRLVGYENRVLRNEDFANDRVDAGDVGAGHTVTALYELTLAGARKRQVEALRYGDAAADHATAAGETTKFAGELGELRIRYKAPSGDTSKRIATPITRAMLRPLPETSPEYRFAAAVAAFGQLLRGGHHTGSFDYEQVQALARPARGEDRFGYRNEFIQLVNLAKALTPQSPKTSLPGAVIAQ
jgi:Ca-activated chloride channel homolog